MSELIESLQWRPQIGDPTIMGWVTVVAYICSAYLSAKVFASASRIFSHDHPIDFIRRQQSFWLFLAIVLFMLSINKQLDLQSLFTEIGRYFAKSNGWYEGRRSVQFSFILGIGAFGVISVVLTGWYIRKIVRDTWLALIGFFFLGMFIFIRAASFHSFDLLLKTKFIGIKANWVFELFGIICIVVSSALLLMKHSRSANRHQASIVRAKQAGGV